MLGRIVSAAGIVAWLPPQRQTGTRAGSQDQLPRRELAENADHGPAFLPGVGQAVLDHPLESLPRRRVARRGTSRRKRCRPRRRRPLWAWSHSLRAWAPPRWSIFACGPRNAPWEILPAWARVCMNCISAASRPRSGHVEADPPGGVVGQLHVEHLEIEVHIRGHQAGVFGHGQFAPVGGQQAAIVVDREDAGELHEPEVIARPRRRPTGPVLPPSR